MYYVYMLRCEDNSIYTGITTDIVRRMKEHMEKGDKCAKYTMSHTAKKLVALWECESRKEASKLEYHLKRMKKDDKEKLANGAMLGDVANSEKIKAEKYERVGTGVDADL